MSKKVAGVKPKLIPKITTSISSLAPKLAKQILENKFEKLKTNAFIIVFSILFIIIILFFYYNSKGYKENKALVDMINYKLYVITGSNLDEHDNINNKLCDFYVSCAYKPYMVDKQLFGYCSLQVMKSILLAGVRCVYIDIFNSSMTTDADPVINNGYMEGEWKMAFNSINFEDMCILIKKVVFSSGYVNNSNDPFILCLNLKTNGNYRCLNKVKKILFEVFGNILLDNTFTYSSKYVMNEPIKNLMGKLIIFSSSGFENSDLEEFINYSWDKNGLKKITYESLDDDSENTAVVKLDNQELKNFNMNGITLVTPNEHTIFTYNYDPKYGWNSGSQFVFMNFQVIDENMNTYIEKFQSSSFIKKPNNMTNDSEEEKIELKVNKEIKNNRKIMEEPLTCPEKPSENYDNLLGDEFIFHKDKGYEGLGLCYGINEDDNCNCNINSNAKDGNIIKCDDTLWTPRTINYNDSGSGSDSDKIKLCCSNRRINDPSLQDTKFFYSKDDCNSDSDTETQNIYIEGDANSNPQLYNKCKIKEYGDLNDNNVCLLNFNENKKCPKGWNHTNQLSEKYERHISMCCKQL